MKNSQRALRAAIFCLAVILSAGCSTLSPLDTNQETLEERVKNYMQAQIDGKWELVYSFYDASSRETVARETYIRQPRKLSYKGYTIEEIAMLPSGNQATVTVRIHVSFRGYDFTRAPQTQEWVKEKGAWFIKFPAQSRNNPLPMPNKRK